MKKRNTLSILFTLCLALITQVAFANSNEIIIPDAAAKSGEIVHLSVDIENDLPFTGFQVDVVLPDQFSYIEGSGQINNQRATGHFLSIVPLGNNVYRFLAFSFESWVFTGNDGPVAFLSVQAPEQAGNFSVGLENGSISDPNGFDILTGTTDGNIKLYAGENIILVPPAIATAGQQAEIELEIVNEDPFTAFQVDVIFQDEFDYIEESAALNPMRITDHDIIAVMIDNNTLRITAFSGSNQAFTGNDGTILSLLLQTPDQTGTFPVVLAEGLISSAEGFDIMKETQDGTLTLMPPPENVMAIPHLSGQAGQETTVQIIINNEEEFTGFQTDIILPQDFAFVAGSEEINEARADDHMIMAMEIGDNILRITAFSFNNLPFAGNEGPVAEFSLQTPETPGEYPLNLENALISNLQGFNILTETINGLITLEGESDLILQNITIAEGETSCFHAAQTIMLAGNDTYFTAEPGANLTLIAGQNIRMLPGTHLQNGSTVHAYISADGTPCPPDEDKSETRQEELITGIIGLPNESGELFSVYPNPTDAIFNINMHKPHTEQNVKIDIFSLDGNTVISHNIPAQHTHTINLDGKRPGMYIVRVTHNNQTEVKRIIKR